MLTTGLSAQSETPDVVAVSIATKQIRTLVRPTIVDLDMAHQGENDVAARRKTRFDIGAGISTPVFFRSKRDLSRSPFVEFHRVKMIVVVDERMSH